MRRLPFVCLFVSMLASAGTSLAAPEAAVDVVIRDPPPPRRRFVIAWNPLPSFTLGKLSLDVVIAPVDHHALIVSPFYAWTSTAAIYVFDDAGKPTQLAAQKFQGGGAELGYRYYFGRGGPRGFYLGPSLILAGFNATAGNGSETRFFDYGVAADVGYQMLIADRFSLSVGGGIQYLRQDRAIPPQQFPAKVYANTGVLPRLLLALGCAF